MTRYINFAKRYKKIVTLFSMVFIVLGVSLGFSTVAKDTVVKSDNWTIENPTIKLFGENPEGEKIAERKDNDLPNLRTMFSKTFENEDGTYSQESFFTPINYQDENDSWQPIDSRIVRSDDPTFDYMNETNIFKTYFTIDPFGNRQNVKYQIGDAWMTFRTLSEVSLRPSIEEGLSLISNTSSTDSQLIIKDLKYADLKKEFTKKRTRKLLGLWERYAPKTKELGHIPSNQKNTLRYGKILEISSGETIDIDYSIKPLNLLEEIILNTPQNIGSFSQEVLLNNAYAKKEGESIGFYNKKTDEKIWTLPKPVMYEYFERWNENIKNPSRFENFGLHYEIECKDIDIEIQDCNNLIISKVIDEEGKTWLNDESRQYPVAIDLTVNYDFTDTTDNWAYEKGGTLPTTPIDGSAATTTNYTNLSTSTDTWWSTSLATTTGQYDSQIYRFTIDQIISEIASINVQWEGYGEVNGTSTTDLKVWKNASSTWQQLDSIDFSTTTDQVASGTISTNISSYIDASTTFSVLVATPPPPAIGDSYQGGIIAYILQEGDPGYDANVTHGLIAATADQSTGTTWGCYETTISGADGTAIGTGNQNTIDIMAGCSTAGIAARICGDLSLNDYTDWYLPSKDELNRLYVNKTAIGGFTDYNYWSSSEDNANNAWSQYFYDGNQYNRSKTNSRYVRAIRAF